MPPSRPFSAEELIEVLRRVADSSLQQSAAINRQAIATERLIPQFEGLRHDISDIKDKLELDGAKLDLQIGKVGTDLAVLLDNIKRAQTDVRELQRDVTGAHLLPPRDERGTAERLLDKFRDWPAATKLWLFALVLVIIAGLGMHLILAAFGIGS